MKPLRITATAFRSWEQLNLTLDDGCTAITGQNGHGKSSIMLAIETALFGGGLARRLNWDGASTELEVCLLFDHAGCTYQARRHYSARGSGKTTLDLEMLDPGREEWIPLTCATTTETQARLEQILGFGVDVFRASAWLAQRGDSFTTAPARDRKRILADILNLDLWPRLLARATTDRKQAEQELARLAARRDQIDSDLAFRDETRAQHQAATTRLAQLRDQRDDLEKGLASLQEEIRQHDTAHAAADEAAREHAHLARQAARERDQAAQADRAIAALNARLAEKPTLEQSAGRIPDLERERDEIDAAWIAHGGHVEQRRRLEDSYGHATGALETRTWDLGFAENRVADLTHSIEELRASDDPECVTCGQPLHGEARARAIAAAEQEIAAARHKVEEERSHVSAAQANVEEAAAALDAFPVPEEPPSRAQIERDLAQAQDARVKLGALAEVEQRLADARSQAARAAEQLDDLAPALDRAQARLDETRAELAKLGDREQLEHRHHSGHAASQNLHRQIEDAISDQARWQARLDQLAQQEAELPAIDQARTAASEHVRALAALEKAYGPNGIPALILETTAIPALEQDATQLLRQLGLDRRVELRTQTAQKTTDTLKDALEIVVVSPTGAEALYGDLSGGELTRLDLALRIALARLVARRPGVEIGVLALDEPEGLDEHGLASLAGILRSLDEFPVRIVVSHHPGLRDAFDRSIQVEKHNGVSRIAGHDIEEPIAA